MIVCSMLKLQIWFKFKLPFISEVRRNLKFSFKNTCHIPSLVGLHRTTSIGFKALNLNCDGPEKKSIQSSQGRGRRGGGLKNSAPPVDLKVELTLRQRYRFV